MIVLPDGAVLEMSWKQIKYTRNGNFLCFQIIPMTTNADIIVFPDEKSWKNIENIFPIQEREEILFLISNIKWKRDIRFFIAEIEIYVNQELNNNISGTIESTAGYKKLDKENLFDYNSPLSSEQVKSIFEKLEIKFAKGLKGNVTVPNNTIIPGSVMSEVVLPVLKENQHINLIFK